MVLCRLSSEKVVWSGWEGVGSVCREKNEGRDGCWGGEMGGVASARGGAGASLAGDAKGFDFWGENGGVGGRLDIALCCV